MSAVKTLVMSKSKSPVMSKSKSFDWGNFWAIFKREFRGYFATPIALIFLTVFLILTGIFTFKISQFYEQGTAVLTPFFVWHPWLYLFIAPAIAMRLWAEERKSGTIELLLTLPVSLFESMLGKFCAAWAFVGVALLLTTPLVLTTCYLGDPDLGVIFGAYIGSFLMAGTFLAVGCAVSAGTENQVISFVVSTAICLVLVLISFEPVIEALMKVFPSSLVEQLSTMGLAFHFESVQRGIIDIKDLIYFLSVIFFSLVCGAVIIDKKKGD